MTGNFRYEVRDSPKPTGVARMNLRICIGRNVAFFLLAAALSAPALAQSPQEAVIAQLRAQGYESFTVGRTLLGRVRILASGIDRQREIVLNPRSGEILRDYTELSDGTVVPQIVDRGGSDGNDPEGSEGGSSPSRPEQDRTEDPGSTGSTGGSAVGKNRSSKGPGGDGRGSNGRGGDGRGR